MPESGPLLSPSRFPFWLPLGGILLSLLYLPTLSTRFDFIDDGNLVYPAPPMPITERVDVVWQKIADNYDHLGPFRPVLWVHWELAADLLQGNELGWRMTRLLWCGFAANMFLWLLKELRIPALAALFAAAVAMWNPYRNEIWTSLTLSEGVAMPYAMLALVSARRASASRLPLAWDVLGMACVLAALACKNTFAALIPAQIFLRAYPDGMSFREGWKRHGLRSLILGITLLAPIIHYVYFRLNWHEGQYLPGGPSLVQFRRVLSGLTGAVSLDFLGAGLLLTGIALVTGRGEGSSTGGLHGLIQRYRAAVGTGALLLAGGTVLYLPIDGMSGRYTMPAVWGLDLWLAVAVAGLVELPASRWKSAAIIGLLIGLAAVAVASVGRQQKFAAKADLIWQLLEQVERTAPPDSAIAWVCGNSQAGELNVEEGIHFQWHLAARGRTDIHVVLVGPDGQPLNRREIQPASTTIPSVAIWGGPWPQGPAGWVEREHFSAPYWFGRKRFAGHLGTNAATDGGP